MVTSVRSAQILLVQNTNTGQHIWVYFQREAWEIFFHSHKGGGGGGYVFHSKGG